MLEIFSTREIVVALYFLLILIICLAKPSIRPYIINVVKCALVKELVIPFLLVFAYAFILVYMCQLLPIWNWIYLKDIIVWVTFIGVPICFKAGIKQTDKQYFKSILLYNLKFAVLIEFWMSSFTFSFFSELFIQLIIPILFGMQLLAKKEDKYKVIAKFLDILIPALGFIFIGITVYMAISTYTNEGAVDMLIRFCIPMVFSLCYLPIAYVIGLFTQYRRFFMRMSCNHKGSKKALLKKKWRTFKICKFSFEKASKLEDDYWHFIISKKWTVINDPFCDYLDYKEKQQ